MESLIDAVWRYPCLWNPLHRDYRDNKTKEAAWQQVVETINHSSISNGKQIYFFYYYILKSRIVTAV